MIAPAERACFRSRMADLDKQIALTHAEGYCVDGCSMSAGLSA